MRGNYSNLDELLNQLFKIYDLYENFIWDKNNDMYRLKVLIDNKLFRVMLLTKDDVIDFFQIRFDYGERELQEYIALSVFRYAFRDIQVHNNGNNYYNAIHRSYLKYEVDDVDMISSINIIMNKHNKYKNDELDNELYFKYNKLKKSNMIDNNIIDIAKARVSLSRRLVKGD